jgi:hypothetical protein
MILRSAATMQPARVAGDAGRGRRAGPDHAGAFIILSTPYTASGAVDYEDLAGEADFLVRCGVQRTGAAAVSLLPEDS